MSKNLKINVAWLDGYLNALSSIDGNIREFFATAFLMERLGNKSALDAVVTYFQPDANFFCVSSEHVSDWVGYLEKNIGKLLLNRPMNYVSSDEYLIQRRSYLAFRIMDMISNVMTEKTKATLYDIAGHFQGGKNSTRFFILASDKFCLTLQFMREA